MDKIEQCVSDVVAIANGARDHEQAKTRIKELLDDAKFQLGQRFSTAHRLRDQLRAVYNDVEIVSAKQFLDELIESARGETSEGLTDQVRRRVAVLVIEGRPGSAGARRVC